MVVEMDQKMSPELIKEVESLKGVLRVTYV
jgi:hypothetical protein